MRALYKVENSYCLNDLTDRGLVQQSSDEQARRSSQAVFCGIGENTKAAPDLGVTNQELFQCTSLVQALLELGLERSKSTILGEVQC